MGISYIAYITEETGVIQNITGVPGVRPSDGAIVNSLLVKHIMKEDLEDLGFQSPAQFLEETRWINQEWVDLGAKPSPWYKYADGWRLNTEAIHKELRLTRNHLLYESDWTQMPDSPLNESTKLAWKNYRQVLRDFTQNIPNDLEDPNDYVWPTPPS